MSQEANPRAVWRVGISGSYGGLNLGDEAILQGIVGELSRSLPIEITVFSRDAADTRARHAGVARVVPVRDLSRSEISPEIARLDVFILGGGGILFDAEAKIYLREVELALEHGVPVMVYAVSAGPLRTPEAQALVRDCLSAADVVTVRDAEALKLLEEIGVKRDIVVTADPALLIQPEPIAPDALEREGVRPGGSVVAMSVREPGEAAPDLDSAVYNALLANAADFMIERFDADVVFVPMEPRRLDMAECHAVISNMLRARRATVLKGDYTSGQLLSLFARFSFAVGMRLHFLIFAALQRVPFVALPYAGKVGSFLADMGLVMPPIEQVNAGRLLAHIDASWDRKMALRLAIDRQLPVLRRRAAETNRILVRLLRGRPGRGQAESGGAGA
jgi:polysaccharide pyruvyl transferase CsaB